MSEQQILSQLSVDNVRKHVRHIVDSMPSRLAGAPNNAARMAEYSAAELRAAGLEARIEAIPGRVSFPREALLTILSPEHKAIPANTFGHSVETPLMGSAAIIGGCRCALVDCQRKQEAVNAKWQPTGKFRPYK